jgi:hypothetical protein
VAASVVLLAVATFVYRGFQQQLGSGPGFRVDHLLMMSFAPSQAGYNQPQAQRFFEQVLDSARLVPGVKSAALTRYMPMDGGPPAITIIPEGFQFPAGKDNAAHASSIVDEHYFDTIGVPILKGRAFRAGDSADAPKVAVVNDRLAERYWPGQNAIGKRFRVDNGRGPWVEIIGVAATTKYGFAIAKPLEFVYLPYRQRLPESMFLLVRSLGDPAALVTPLREMIHGLDANLPIYNVANGGAVSAAKRRLSEHQPATIGAMGLMGLVAVVGLYGRCRSRPSADQEIGIRWRSGRPLDGPGDGVAAGMVLAVAGLASARRQRRPRAAGRRIPGGGRRQLRFDVVAFPLVAAAVLAVTLVAATFRRARRINRSTRCGTVGFISSDSGKKFLDRRLVLMPVERPIRS